MKKLLSLLLMTVMILGLCACGKTEAPPVEEKTFRVGYARVDITPKYNVPLAGYGNTSQRFSNGFLSYLYTTCIAITDAQDSTVLLFTTDMIAITDHYTKLFREAVTAATGVPAERIMFSNTHSHSGPDLWSNEPIMAQYMDELAGFVTQAATEAMADRSPATMETGVGYTEGLNFVRHYTTSSGEIYGDNLELKGVMTGHTSDPDNEIQLIRFRRAAEGKKDILAVNWQAHVKVDSSGETMQGQANRGYLSADYVGGARDYVEKNSDCLFAFYLGAAGNLNPNSKMTQENYSTDCKVYSAKLGEYIVSGMESLQPVQNDAIAVSATQKIYSATSDHSEDDKVADATAITEIWYATNNYAQAMAAAPDSGICSPYHAMSIINRSKVTVATREMELNAISVGPIGFITAPYEMFDVNGMEIKDGSPFETTFVITCANGHHDYIAADYAFEGRGTYEVHNRRFIRGTAEDLAQTYVDMLNSLA